METCKALEEAGVSAAHYDMRFVKPLDSRLLEEVFTRFDKVLTVEDGCIMGGFGSAVLEWAADKGYHTQVKRLGIPDSIFEQGEQGELQREAGFCPDSIFDAAQKNARSRTDRLSAFVFLAYEALFPLPR